MKHPWVTYSATSASSSDCHLQSVKLKKESRGLSLQHTAPNGCQRQELFSRVEAESAGTGWQVLLPAKSKLFCLRFPFHMCLDLTYLDKNLMLQFDLIAQCYLPGMSNRQWLWK